MDEGKGNEWARGQTTKNDKNGGVRGKGYDDWFDRPTTGPPARHFDLKKKARAAG